MSKEKDYSEKDYSKDDSRQEAKPALKAEVTAVDPKTIATPEGLDDAIFQQGVDAALKDAAKGEVHENAFQAGTHQADSWQAGYDAAMAVITPPAP
jgi:hypothetical protein